MGKLKDAIHEYKKLGLANEKKMWESIECVDELLCDMEIEHPEAYWEFMRNVHAIYMGNHYNEMFALNDVAKMSHKDKTGNLMHGEYWSIGQVKEAILPFKNHIPASYNPWDVYVALNANYHDKCVKFAEWFPTDHETKIIEDAIHFYFRDEDAPDGKVWLYMEAMDD